MRNAYGDVLLISVRMNSWPRRLKNERTANARDGPAMTGRRPPRGRKKQRAWTRFNFDPRLFRARGRLPHMSSAGTSDGQTKAAASAMITVSAIGSNILPRRLNVSSHMTR
jgi:hypothetical protein